MSRTDDLIHGSIHRQLIALAIPLIIGNILQQFYNTIDSFIVGRYIGQNAFAATGVAGSLMNLFIFVLNGGCNGISVIFAQLYGERNWASLRRESFLSLAFGTLFSAALSIVSILSLSPLLRVIQTPPEITGYVTEYLWIIYLGLPVTFLYNWCAAALRAVGDTGTALWALLIAMVLNFLLDLLLVAQFQMGIAGTAVATVIAQLLSAGVCVIYMGKRHPHLLFDRGDISFDGALLRQTADYGIVSALHQSSLYIGKLLVQGAVNTGGTDVISAYTATMRIEGFANSFGDSGANAVSVFVAQNRGAGDSHRIRKGLSAGLVMMSLLGVVLSLIMAFSTRWAVILLMGEVPARVMDHAAGYMTVIAVFYVLCFVGNTFVGLYRGIGMVRVPVLGTILQITIRVILSYLLINTMGLAAIALATGVGWAAVVSYQIILYRVKVRNSLT